MPQDVYNAGLWLVVEYNICDVLPSYEQSHFTVKLARYTGLWWIGLRATGDSGGVDYIWDNGAPLTFTHWDRNQPGTVILHPLSNLKYFPVSISVELFTIVFVILQITMREPALPWLRALLVGSGMTSHALRCSHSCVRHQGLTSPRPLNLQLLPLHRTVRTVGRLSDTSGTATR